MLVFRWTARLHEMNDGPGCYSGILGEISENHQETLLIKLVIHICIIKPKVGFVSLIEHSPITPTY